MWFIVCLFVFFFNEINYEAYLEIHEGMENIHCIQPN